MMHFEGTETFAAEPAEVFARLADAGWIATALPDETPTVATPDHAVWRVRPKFAFMAGSLETAATVSYRTPDRSVRFRIQSTGVGSNSLMEATLTVRPREASGSVVHWTGDLLALGGLLGQVPRAMVQAASLRVVADIWRAIHLRMEEG